MIRPVFLAAILAAVILSGCAAPPAELTLRVERVIDGDTFVVHYDGEPTSVRLYGIDAPEIHTAAGPAAHAALVDLVGGRDVALTFPTPRKRDHFGRLLCQVMVTDAAGAKIDVAEKMLSGGFAVPYFGGPRPKLH